MNVVSLFGNLGRDFEVASYESPKNNGEKFFVAKNSLAITKKDTRRNEKGEKVTIEHTDWIPITLFGKNAENAAKFFKKGSKFLCEGKITTSSYIDEKGQTKYGWGVDVKKFHFTQAKAAESDSNAQSNANLPEPPQELENANVVTDETIQNATETSADEFEFNDENLPFG